jgi:hypothetical protein
VDQYYVTTSLSILDISVPSEAHVIKKLTATAIADDLEVSGSYAYLSEAISAFKGFLEIIDVDPPDSAHKVTTVNTPSAARSVAVLNNYAYVSDAAGLEIIKLW